MRIVDRYVLSEALGPFLVALGAFIVLVTGHMLFQVVEVIVEHGVPLPSVLRFIALQVPNATVMALPVATLMGCSLAVNRLSSDHEIVAMRTGGMSLARMMLPMWGLGIIASIATFAISEAAVPWSRAQAEALVREMVLGRQSLAFEPNQFTDTGQGITIYVNDRVAEREELRDVLILTQAVDHALIEIMLGQVIAEILSQRLEAPCRFEVGLAGEGQASEARGRAAATQAARPAAFRESALPGKVENTFGLDIKREGNVMTVEFERGVFKERPDVSLVAWEKVINTDHFVTFRKKFPA